MKIQIICLSLLLSTAGILNTAAQPEPQTEYTKLAEQPDNVLLNIARNISDQDLDNFARTSRRLRAIAKTVRAERFGKWEAGPIKMEVFAAHTGPVHSLYFLSDDNIVSIGTQDGSIKVSDSKSGKEIRKIIGSAVSPVELTAFSPKSNILAICYKDNAIGLWNVKSGDKIDLFLAPRPVFGAALSFDGQTLALGLAGGDIILLDVKERTDRTITTDYQMPSPVFSPDGTRLAISGSHGEGIREWNVQNTITKGREYKYQGNRLSFLADGKLIDIRVTYPAIIMVDVATDKTIVKFMSKLRVKNATLLSHNENLFAISCEPSFVGITVDAIVIWNAKTGKEIKKLDHKKDITSLAFSFDDNMLAAGSNYGSIIVWKAGQ